MSQLKRRVGGLAFRVARSPLGGRLVGRSFAHLSALLPVAKLHETASLVAFYHPRPVHKFHILLVPKQAIPSLLTVGPAELPLMQEVVVVAQQLVEQLGLAEIGYRLIVNGGRYQDVPQLHFHLVAD